MDTYGKTTTETLYVQKWPDAATVADTVGVLPTEVVAVQVTVIDGVLDAVREEVVTDPELVAAINAMAEAQKASVR